MNQIMLVKVYLGSDAVTKDVNGDQVIEFSVAESRKYKDQKGDDQEYTQWYKCSYWSKSKIHEFLKKGTSVFVQGVLNPAAYLDKQGRPALDLKIKVDNIVLLDKKPTDKEEEAISEQSQA